MAIHAFSHAALSNLRNQPRLVILRDQIVQVVVGLQNHAATATAVAAARTALRNISLAMESHRAFPTVSRSRKYFNFVDEHPCLGLILNLNLNLSGWD